MKQRTLTGIALALLSMVLLGCFHLPWVPQIIAILLGCGAVWEILEANGVRGRGAHAAGFFLAVIVPLFPLTENRWWMLAMLLLGLGFFTYLMTRIRKTAPAWVAAPEIVLALSLYRGLASYGQIPHGAFYLCLTGLICALTDIFAFLVGSRFGRHKLAPKVSPGKSIEGALGGLGVTVVLILLVFGRFFSNPGALMLYTVVVSLLGQFGDLSMSAVKRVAGVKDFGKIFPGHGGILDRCDSLMYPLAVTWLLYCFDLLIFA